MAKQARALATRQRILEGAAEVFEEYGYAATTMAVILQRCGVTKGALYFHFASKEELARAILAADEKLLSALVSGDAPPLQLLIDASHGFASELQDNVISRASVRLAIEHGTFSKGDFTTHVMWQGGARELLEKARQQGDLRPEVDIDALAGTVVAAFTGAQIVSQAMTGRRDLRQRLTHFWTFLLPGIVPDARVSRFDPAGASSTGPAGASGSSAGADEPVRGGYTRV
ncbi:ScbR family autoregulator-binding transcription factor [Sphaerisporangium perillae]|uniref:ScbR family autoregulator-binding transcription factor n=1 Tax=Sphaerisporangium perillae TaxID=2935860 RepID=UPI0020101929|nr:ScbR family autoregulator-binding transcription factor [Sphaerisporangium perillae]